MHTEIVKRDNDFYRIEIHHRMTPDFKYRGTVKVFCEGSLVTEVTCLTIRPVQWDVQCDGWDVLRSLGYKRIESKVWDI